MQVAGISPWPCPGFQCPLVRGERKTLPRGLQDVNGFKIEHLIFVILGGNNHIPLKSRILWERSTFLKVSTVGSLAAYQFQLFYAIKLAATSKDEIEASSILFSESGLKK